MPHNQSLSCWTRLLVVTFLTTGQFLRADNTQANSADTKVVPVKAGNSTVNVQVKEAANPYRNVSSSGSPEKYQPDHINFGSTSPLAHKEFLAPESPLSKSASILKQNDQSTFVAKSYFADATSPAAPSTANLDAHVSLPSTNAYSRNANGFNKDFTTSSFDARANRAALLASKTSADQDRTAVLGKQGDNTFSSPLGSKTYLGPEAEAVHRDLTRISQGLVGMKDLPNRPLTIDEVRALINHGVKPDTSVEPEPPTKPLNSPDYKPEVSPEPPSTDVDKNDLVPSPGTMASPPPPENSEPLPSR